MNERSHGGSELGTTKSGPQTKKGKEDRGLQTAILFGNKTQIIVKNNGPIAIKKFIDHYKRPLVRALDALLKGDAREAGGKWKK